MKGKIIRIDPLKESRNKGQAFYRVHFNILNDDGTTTYNHTDLVTSFRNFARWKPLMKMDNIISNLKQLKNGKIDADSEPKLCKEAEGIKTKLVYDKDRNVMVVVPDVPVNNKLDL